MNNLRSILAVLFLSSSMVAFAAPSITSLTPSTGAVGASVTIAGSGFGTTQGTSIVKFNGTTATVTSWSATSIAAKVPTGATTGNVVVTVSGAASNGKSFTVVAAPGITSLSPTSGAVATSVTITGTNFGTTQGTSTVKFNGTTATPTSWSATSIKAPVPAGATTGNVVVHASGVDSNGSNFTVLPTPSITSLSPTSGAVGASVTIAGTNFGSTQGTSTVKFNGTTATATSWSATSIAATVPAGATTGNVVVTVSGVASNGSSFTVVAAPGITSLSPTSGAVGTSVTITGTNFGTTQGSSTVKFNGTTATPTSWSATSIKAPVPAGATTGNVVVHASGVDSNGSSFTVLPSPSITSLSPNSGAVGASVTITGTNFGATQGTSTVKFNGTTATATSWSATSIAATVPTGATTGNVVVTVSGIASNGSSFTVVAAPSITSLSPASGAAGVSVTITGTNFGATQGSSTVKFNGTTATPTSWNATTIKAPVPSGAATGNVVVHASGVDSNGKPFTVPPFSLSGSLNTARYLQPATVLPDGRILIAGGWNALPLASAELYDPATGTFTAIGDMTTSRAQHTATLLSNGQVLIAGGFDQNFTTLNSAEIYNPATGVFSPIASMNAARNLHTATALADGTVLIAGGGNGSGNLASAELYNPVTGVFTPVGNLSVARVFHTATLLNSGKVLIVAGQDNSGNPLLSAELYDPATAAFSSTGSLNSARINHTTNLLNGGKVLVAGGSNSSVLNSAELYDPVAGSFVLTGNLNTAREDHAATLLNNGTVLLSGGLDSSFNALASAELYDPVAGSFALAGNLNVARWNHSGTLLNNGNTLVAGGRDINAIDLASSELYRPSSLQPAGLVSIALTPSAPSIQAGVWQRFTATGTFSDNSTKALASAEWSSSNTAVAIATNDVSNPGNAAAFAPGSVTISACTGAICGSANLTITASPNAPNITALAPASGAIGTPVMITGVNFGASQGAGFVKFNGALAEVLGWSNGAILARVPAGAASGPVTVTVGIQVSNGFSFTVPPPSITSLTPATAAVGASLTITGANFGPFPANGSISFNGTAAAAITWSDTSLLVQVPTGATSGPVTVHVGSQVSNAVTFTIAPSPSISGLSPSSANAGTSITISGANFGLSQGASTITFNGTLASEAIWNDTSIVVPVPLRATSGNVVVTVAGRASNGVAFTVPNPAPNLTGISPASAQVGVAVTVSGSHFGATQGQSTITFNGTTATPTSWSDTSVTAAVPVGATSGNVIITANSQDSNGLAFTVIRPPTITSVTPASNSIGSPVTVTGTNFGTFQGTSSVTFNGVAGTPVLWSATSIIVPVPAGATTGNLVVTVGGVSSNGVNYPIVARPSVTGVSPASGTVGTAVTISGSNFGATQGSGSVTFGQTVLTGGTNGVPTSWSDTSIVVPVPSGAVSGILTVTANGSLSNGVCFQVGSAPPCISSVTPNSGGRGTAVTITGINFGSTQGSNFVQFGFIPASISSWSDTVIQATVPSGAGRAVVVNVGPNSSNSVPFSVPTAPVINNIAPSTARRGDAVTVNGSKFGATQGNSFVTFGGSTASINSWSDSAIVALVPSNPGGFVQVGVAGVGSNKVTFTLDNGFTLTSLSPASGPVGTVVTISGSDFGSAQGTSTITFNGIPATPFTWSNGSIVAPVPPGATTGPVVVTVGGVASNSLAFTVVPSAAVVAISPATGAAGVSVTISGANFGASQGSSAVRFNGLPAAVASWSSTSIVAIAPSGVSTGPVTVTVTGQASNGVTFTALTSGTIAGTVTNASGGAAVAGASVTLLQNRIVKSTATTSGAGAYIISNMPAGSYDLQISATGLGTALQNAVAISGGSTTTLNVSLSAPGTIAGKVTQADGVTGISGATVTIFVGSAVGSTATTDSNGNYSIGSLSAASYSLEASAAGFVTKSQLVSLAAGGTSTANFALQAAGNGAVNYVYDELGRLVAVIDSNGDTATYNYDAVGNILSIGRHSSSQVSIVSFTPTTAPIGSTVNINGTNFSATASQNTVSFNGVSATISSATATQLVTSVPAGATTGPISVTAPAGSATSAASFTVGSLPGAPTIASFTPTIGPPGTTVAITGTNFDPIATKVWISTTKVVPSTISSTSLSINASVGSGHIKVATGAGTALSTQDFFATFNGHAAGDVGYAGRISIGGTQTITLNTPNQIALLIFDANVLQGINVQLSGSTFTTCTMYLIDPTGAIRVNPSDCTSATTAGPSTIAFSAGTYMIGIDPGGTTGSINVALSPNTAGGITVDGPPVTVNTTSATPDPLLTFPGTPGQRVLLQVSNVTNPAATVWLLRPDAHNSTLVSIGNTPPGQTFLLGRNILPLSGTYELWVQHSDTNVGSETLQLTTVPPDVNGSVTVGGAAFPISTVIGQFSNITFNNPQTQSLTIQWTSGTYGTCDMTVTEPSGAQVLSTCTGATGTVTLGQMNPGTYVISLRTPSPGAMSLSVTTP